jgi:hypothetical protein
MKHDFPPPGFELTESAVQGIEVYKPIPAGETPQKEIVDFTCPQCGATTAFSVENSGLTCSYCGYFEPAEENLVGEDAQSFEFTIATLQQSAQGWGEERKDIECRNCGAEISVPGRSLTHTCVFCGSNKVIQRRAVQDELRPKFLIPFKINQKEVKGITNKWLQDDWRLPASLKDLSQKAEYQGLYLPFWVFDSVTVADWKAEVGHEKTKRYFQDGEWKTKTVIEWRWESGHVEHKYDDVLIQGTDRISELHFKKIRNYELRELIAYNPEYLAGMYAKSYDIPLEKAWEKSRIEIREATRQLCRDRASTPRIRNFSMTMDYDGESWRYILLPVYLAVYNYQEKAFQLMINGQNGAISGQRPVDWTKVWLAIAAILMPGVLLGLIGLVTLPIGGIGAVIGMVGFVFLIAGVVISIFIIHKSNQMDDI